MLRNRRNRYDFMGDNGRSMASMEPQMQPLPPASRLDAQSERLAEQAEDIGWLKGQNDMLNEDNQRLEQTVKDLEERNSKLQERNTELEKQASADREGYKSGSQLVDEIEAALAARKEKK